MDKNFEKELLDMFEGFLNSMDFKYHYEDSDGNVIDYPKKQTTKTCDCKKPDQTASVSNDSYVKEQLIKKINDLEKENADLKQKNNDIFKYGKDISDTGHKIVVENDRLNNQIKRMLYTDGNKIVSDIKILIETARGCGMIDDPNFVDAMKMIAKVANDFVSSRKPIYVN